MDLSSLQRFRDSWAVWSEGILWECISFLHNMICLLLETGYTIQLQKRISCKIVGPRLKNFQHCWVKDRSPPDHPGQYCWRIFWGTSSRNTTSGISFEKESTVAQDWKNKTLTRPLMVHDAMLYGVYGIIRYNYRRAVYGKETQWLVDDTVHVDAMMQALPPGNYWSEAWRHFYTQQT